ncbi:hypothetical protein [Georgenia thermotolerans]|uniref:Uncharacterized protein n=1 Tax=Georgenia thermotolerans TaxID=527326 RepID=A0A7J5UQB5_9MICO|nr:hypothetical protein [Georgenia thermotolerans]KAE8764606.1 hypothetical protein GB883_08015 [Georgenia thermotolerans]
MAVRGALMRMCYAGGAVFVVVTVAGLMAEFKAVSAAVGLAVGAVAAASVRVDGGRRRRADLGDLGVTEARADGLLTGATVLGAVVSVVAAAIPLVRARQGSPDSALFLDWGSVMPAEEYYTLPIVAAASVLLTGVAWLGYRRVLRRRSLDGVDTSVDHALRGVSARRIGAGALSGQIILLGTTVAATPLLTQETTPPVAGGTAWQMNPQLVSAAADLGLVAVIVGLVVAATSLMLPFWSAAAHQPLLAASEDA